MKSRLGTAASVLAILVIVSGFHSAVLQSAAADLDPRNPGLVNKLLSINKTPGTTEEGLAPGNSDSFELTIRNPYDGNMTNVTLTAAIYMYATLQEARDVTSSWTTPHISESGSVEYMLPQFDLDSDEHLNVSFTIVTRHDTPHGDVFSQSSYFMRFLMEFDYTNSTVVNEHMVMKSPGHFSSEVWEEALREPTTSDLPYYRGEINITYLEAVSGQLDGILPDSSFALKEPIPTWPFYLLIAVAVIAGFLALMFYIEENPGTWPWMETRWLGFRSRMSQTFRFTKRGIEKKVKGSERKRVK
jgi:hypothetical protein